MTRQNGPRTDIGRWISTMLRSRRWYQTDLAERMGVDPSQVSKWSRGARTPDIPHCRAIARAFDVPESVVLSIAGHLPADALDPRAPHQSLVREEAVTILESMPEPVIEDLLPLLRRLIDDAQGKGSRIDG